MTDRDEYRNRYKGNRAQAEAIVAAYSRYLQATVDLLNSIEAEFEEDIRRKLYADFADTRKTALKEMLIPIRMKFPDIEIKKP